MQDDTLLTMTDVHCRRGGRRVLHGVNLGVRAGEVVGLLGPNGAGKSTTVELALGLLSPVSGGIRVTGAAPGSHEARRCTGAMMQSGQPAQAMRVGEWLALARAGHRNPMPLADLLRITELGDYVDRRCDSLSGGELQRTRLAVALAGGPRLLFLDEPTAGMDVESRHRLWRAIGELRASGCGILMTTHDLDEAEALSDRVALIAEGRIVADDETRAICDRVPGRRVRCRTRLGRDTLQQWPEVETVEAADNHMTLMTRQAEPLVRRLLDADPTLTGLEVSGASLEEAFIHLTRPAQAGEEAA